MALPQSNFPIKYHSFHLDISIEKSPCGIAVRRCHEHKFPSNVLFIYTFVHVQDSMCDSETLEVDSIHVAIPVLADSFLGNVGYFRAS